MFGFYATVMILIARMISMRKICCIREQTIGKLMTSSGDFSNIISFPAGRVPDTYQI